MTRMRVLHREVEPTLLGSRYGLRPTRPPTKENRQISGSPPGVPSPDSLPSEIKFLGQRRVSNRADKAAGNGRYMSLRAPKVRGNLKVSRRLLRRNERSSQ